MRRRPKVQPSVSTLDELLGEASWLLSHAEALADDGRQEEACLELVRAAHCEEQGSSLIAARRQVCHGGSIGNTKWNCAAHTHSLDS